MKLIFLFILFTALSLTGQAQKNPAVAELTIVLRPQEEVIGLAQIKLPQVQM